MAARTAQPWHSNPMIGTYKFFNVLASREQAARSHSVKNPAEALAAVALYDRICRDHPDIDFNYRVGVVTMYKEQDWELKRQFKSRFGEDIVNRIDFNTVDGFQGQEKDIIILSCVRGGIPNMTSLGFLCDVRRMNVALTRSK